MTLRMTQEQFNEIQGRRSVSMGIHRSGQESGKPRPEYVPKRVRRREMNGLEKAYAAHLEALKRAWQIEWYAFEPMRLRLAERTYYTPDFAVKRNGKIEIHETKGFMREAARVRLNVAAETFPFPFFLVRKDGGRFIVSKV